MIIDPMKADIGLDADTGREWTPRRARYIHDDYGERRLAELIRQADERERQEASDGRIEEATLCVTAANPLPNDDDAV